MIRLTKFFALAVVSSVLLAGGLACNTTEGAGKDIKSAGQGIQDAADRNK